MRLFNFFKKKTDKKNEKKEIGQEIISFSEIKNWIEKKESEIELKEKEIIALIKEKISFFVSDIKEKRDILKGIDVESKRNEERLKSIVIDGRKKYLETIDNFLEKLENLKKKRFEKVIEDLNKIFFEFDKISRISYERATILIGKEMAEIKGSMRSFSKDLINVFDKNKDIVNLSKAISAIKLRLTEVKEADKIFKDVGTKIISLDKKIIKEKEESKIIFEKIEKIKKSKCYLENLNRQEKIKLLESEFEKDILDLKQLIDFKELANFFHIFKEQMNLVKHHKEDFQRMFQKDNGASLKELLNQSKLNNEKISDKIKQINIKKEEVTKLKGEIEEDKIAKLLVEASRIEVEIKNLNLEKEREEKRKEKLKEEREEKIHEIKEELGKAGVVVEGEI